MKKPSPRNTPIDMSRMSNWMDDFSGYRHAITEQRIQRWLDQFNTEHQDIAARILDCVDFISHEQMVQAFREILNSLDGWHSDENQRQGKWRFIAFSGSAGESGDTMLHKFRLANGLNGKRYNNLFIHRSDLLREDLGVGDTIVFVDDFSGTGKQVTDAWKEYLHEIMPEGPNVYLILVAASIDAREKINQETGLTAYPYIELNSGDNLFSRDCRCFLDTEKQIILEYCRRANRQNPKGRGECGFVIIFAHTCPNNSIPILHAHHPNWHGLFRRYD